jgi:hypothetical protein
MLIKSKCFTSKQGRKVCASFGNKEDNADFPLSVLPLINEFVSLEKCRVVLMKHNAMLIPPWAKARGQLQITKFSDIHHRGSIVCLRTRNGKKIELDYNGMRVFSRPDYHDYIMICLEELRCKSLKNAFEHSIALTEAIIEVLDKDVDIWQVLSMKLKARYQEYLQTKIFA